MGKNAEAGSKPGAAPKESGYDCDEHLMTVREAGDKYGTHVIAETPAKSNGLTAAEVRVPTSNYCATMPCLQSFSSVIALHPERSKRSWAVRGSGPHRPVSVWSSLRPLWLPGEPLPGGRITSCWTPVLVDTQAAGALNLAPRGQVQPEPRCTEVPCCVFRYSPLNTAVQRRS